MAPLVEARSLTALTVLAANPPQYPRNPTHKVQDPLILYIAKVPGSKDVFLTTMKPQQRVVTAHDIESSLYYFHVDSTNDDGIRQALFAQPAAQNQEGLRKDDQRLSSRGDQSPRRKPLPATAQQAPQGCLEPPSKAKPQFQVPGYHSKDSFEIGRKPLSSSSQQLISVPDIALGVPQHKLIGPRPLHSRQPCTNSVSGAEDVSGKLISTRFGLINHGEPVPNFAVTIIRRDPSSGGQWNVGKLIAGPTFTKGKGSGSFSHLQSLQGNNCISIHITTPGYNRFCREDSVSMLEKLQLNKLSLSGKYVDEQALPGNRARPGFHRQIYLERIRSQSTYMSPGGDDHRFSLDSRQSQTQSTGFPSFPSPNQNLSASANTPFSKPYTFESPWNGTCEFTTGVAGRSLKCKHNITTPATSPRNWSPSTYTVSELRFNLPSSKLFGSFSPKRPRLPASDARRLSFLSSTHTHNRSRSVGDGAFEMCSEHDIEDSDDERDDRMDLSLGQEHAGGGIRGKQAKLGKLIVEDEGLKMLDLVVAANMGVWWYTWGMDN